MSRSLQTILRVRIALPAFIGLAAFATVPAHADMDALLGDWTNHASSQATDQASEQLELTGLQDTNLDLDEGFSFTQSNELPQSNTSVEQLDSVGATPAKEESTLTSNHGEASIIASPSQTQSLYAPTITQNPYATESCGCSTCNGADNNACGCSTRCGGRQSSCLNKGSCGELVSPCEAMKLCGKSECRPHQAPTLPPPSTMLQYFRSRNSYSAIWAGYAEETRKRCRNRSPHIPGNHGAGNCGSTQCGELLAPGSANCGCGCK